MTKIAISYRRADTTAITGRIYDRLSAHFGKQSIFIDVDDIPYGVDFREHIARVLREIDVLVVVVGTDLTGAAGNEPARIFDPSDPVRVEIETALELKTRLLPVLVNDALMPTANRLPPSLSKFSYLNALPIDAGKDFHVHAERLLKAIDPTRLPEPAVPDAGGDQPLPDAAAMGPFLLQYVALPVVLLLLAHYLFVLKFTGTHTLVMRIAAIAIPFAFGFLLNWRARQSTSVAIAVGVATAFLAVAGMHVIVAMIENVSVLPTDTEQWQVAFEFLAGIALAVVGGHLIARLARSAGLLDRA